MVNNSGVRNVVVVGGGPAGMMAALRAAESGASVILLEKNAVLGKKLLLTGKGRCNVTNACDLNSFPKRFGHNGNFLRDAFKAFFNEDVITFFRHQGVPLKTERQGRVFPQSNRSSSIVRALSAALRKAKVDVWLNVRVEGFRIQGERITGVKLAKGRVLEADAVIVATGGVSYCATGSTGDGIRFAEQNGHRIVPLRPALVGLETRPSFGKELQGLTLKNIVLTFQCGKKKIITDVGNLLFTTRGISGPLVISHSGQVADWLGEGHTVSVEMDLKPGLSAEDMERRVAKEIKASPRKGVKNFLKSLLPQRFIEVFLRSGPLDPKKQVNQLTQPQRACLLKLLKCFPVIISGISSWDTAMVTQGGVSVKDVDPRTMASRRIQGLFFAGEMIDVDADTGGFNLQAAFSTGYLAGQSCVEK